MSERGSGEGSRRGAGDARDVSNQNAPDAHPDGGSGRGGDTRGRDDRGRDDSRGGNDARNQDGPGDGVRSVHSREAERGTSWTSVIFGLLAALGAALILSGIVGGIVAAILGALGLGGGAEGGAAALIGTLITLFLAFLVGGYVAGRLASRSGVKHGLFVPLLLLILTILLALIGAVVGYSLIDNLQGVTLPAVPGGVQQQAQGEAPQNLGAILTGSGILALLVPFLGGALGGAWGAKTGRNRP